MRPCDNASVSRTCYQSILSSKMSSTSREESVHRDQREEEDEEEESFWKSVSGDKFNLLFLFFLYTLQGLPIGLSEAIPLSLSERGVSYEEQAQYNSVYYPFSCKLVWAPLVDSLYSRRFGRRKTWLVPAQLCIGITMLVSAQYIHLLMGENGGRPPNVPGLTAMFLCLNMMAATQDVAVDGWALTLLRPSNLGLASSANTLGQTIGWLLGYALYTWLESQGLFSLSQFLTTWGSIFLVSTLTIALLKRESNSPPLASRSPPHPGVWDTYKLVWRILLHPLTLPTMLLLLTYKIGFSTTEIVSNLKLVEVGVPRSTVSVLALPMVPVKVILTLLITPWVAGNLPLKLWLRTFPLRLLLCLLLVLLVYWASTLPLLPTHVALDSPIPPVDLPLLFHICLLTVSCLHLASTFTMQLTIMAFFARVSDPVVGGTHMTFLNTINNLGTMWPRSLSLWLIDKVSMKCCLPISSNYNVTVLEDITCLGTESVSQCARDGGRCETTREGLYILGPVSVLLGFVFLIWGWRTANHLQREDRRAWTVVVQQGEEDGEGKARQDFKYFYCA